MKRFVFIFIAVQLLIAAPSFAQETEADLLAQMNGWEMGFHLGRLLPNQIDGVTEIIPLWGIRGGIGWGSVTTEMGYIGGNGRRSEWNDLHISARANIPVETIIGHVYIGVDLIDYVGVNGEQITRGQWSRRRWNPKSAGSRNSFRGDMKFNVSPGTSMYLGFGFTITMPDGGGN
ncbi:MAG: hypothetical protein R2827_16485 [Bdellovibrionales bacterium]